MSYLYISDLSQTPDASTDQAPATAPPATVVATPATPPATAADKAAALQRQADALELVASQLDTAGQPAAAAAMRAQAAQVRQALADFQATMLPGGVLSTTAKIALGIGGALLLGGLGIGWWLSKKESTAVVPLRRNKGKKSKLWSHAVVTHWKPSASLFAHGSPEKIAREVLKGHSGLLAPSVSTINFYVNRAGSNLSSAAKKRCKKALELVRARGKSAA